MNNLTVRDLALAGTAPSFQVLTMLRRAAGKALDGNLDHEESYLLVAEVLLSLGYVPPADGLTRWQTLLGYLADYQCWNEGVPNHQTAGLTADQWLTMIRAELVAVAGRPL